MKSPTSIISKTIFSFLILFSGQQALAAACCGGNLSVPSLILGDDKAQLTASVAASQVSTDVDDNGTWQSRSNPQALQTYRLEGAHLISDRWQAGATAPVVFSQRDNPSGKSSGSGFGDLALNVGYEALPEWEYSDWRPRGIVFMQVIVPTGRSTYESSNPAGLDVTGKGVYSVGLGAAFTKVISVWDFLAVAQVRRSFARTVSSPTAEGDVRIHPGWGGIAQLAAGYNLKNMRFGAGLALNYEDPMNVTGALQSRSGVERFVTASLSGTYLFDSEWAASLTYSDTRLFGAPVNTTLGPTLSLALQKRWPR